MAAIAAAEVARSASMGVIICVNLTPSNGLGFLGTTIVLPGSITLFEPKKLLLTKELFPLGPIMNTLPSSETSLKPPESSM